MKSRWNQSKQNKKPEHLVEHMELPKDLFLGMPLLSLEGNRTLCVVNHRGILKYCDSAIVIAAKSYRIQVIGRNLCIQQFSGDLIEISGYIEEISFPV